MKTIENNVCNEVIINKSKFITRLYHLNNFSDIDTILTSIQNDYPTATHICYAYIYDNQKKYSDDNEPVGTAGLPIMNVLEKTNLNHILGIVIRYFGGIKLGTSGLNKAYSNSIRDALKLTSYRLIEEYYEVIITLPYNQEQNLLNILKDSIIKEKKYQEIITYTFLIKKDDLFKIYNYNYTIVKSLII